MKTGPPLDIETIIGNTGNLIIEKVSGNIMLENELIVNLDLKHRQYLGALIINSKLFLGHPIRIYVGETNYVSPVVVGFELVGLYQVNYKTEQNEIFVKVDF